MIHPNDFEKILIPIIRRVIPKTIALDILGLTPEQVVREEVEKIEAEMDK